MRFSQKLGHIFRCPKKVTSILEFQRLLQRLFSEIIQTFVTCLSVRVKEMSHYLPRFPTSLEITAKQ